MTTDEMQDPSEPCLTCGGVGSRCRCHDLIALFDTETTGSDDGAQIIESALLLIEPGLPPFEALDDSLTAALVKVERFKPSVPIELGAMAVHHIIEADVADYRPSSEFALPSNVVLLIGHNIDFDWKMAGSPKVKRICTLALARKVWPALDAHTLGAIIYSLFSQGQARMILRDAHSADADVINLLHVLRAVCAVLRPSSWNVFWKMSEEARIPEIITFGKHKAKPGEPPTRIEQLPRSYRDWILREPDMDPYLKIAVRRSLGLPAGVKAADDGEGY